MKKIAVLIAALLLSALCFPACNSEKTDPNAVTIMGKKSDMEKTYMTRIFELYKENTGNNLNILSIEDSEFEDYAEKRFSQGKLPDIFMHFHNADLDRFDVADNFMYLNEQSWVGDLTDSALAYCKDINGNLLGLPFWESSVSGCYYNKKLFDEWGLKPATTQNEFNALCNAIKNVNRTAVCWPADGCSWMTQFGLDPVFADDPALLAKLNSNEVKYADIPAVRDMVQWISDAAKNGWFGKDYLKTGWNEISGELNSGKALMTFIWDTWFYTDFTPGEYTRDDFELMPVFMNTANEGTYEGGNLNMMMVNKNSDKLQKALDFLSFCATPENYNIAFEGIPTVKCFKGMTTNIQSKMVTDAHASIAKYERVSTASTKIIGYSADELLTVLNEFLHRNGEDVDECLRRMDEKRIAKAKSQGAAGF